MPFWSTNPGPWITLGLLLRTLMKILVTPKTTGFLWIPPGSQSQFPVPTVAPKKKKKNTHTTKNTSLPAWSKALLPSLSLNSLVCAVLFDGSLPNFLVVTFLLNGQVTLWSLNLFLYVHWVTRGTWENSCNLTLFQNHKYIQYIDFIWFHPIQSLLHTLLTSQNTFQHHISSCWAKWPNLPVLPRAYPSPQMWSYSDQTVRHLNFTFYQLLQAVLPRTCSEHHLEHQQTVKCLLCNCDVLCQSKRECLDYI